MRSKEKRILELFMNYPKHWHFGELLETSKISRAQLSAWLIRFEKEGIIKRIKKKGKMPYYVQDIDNPSFKNRKKIFALQLLSDSGLLNHIMLLSGAKVAILFGSFSRYDWYADSDIDIFIYGDDSEFQQGKYSAKLKRDVQVHTAKDRKDLTKMDGMLPYIISGEFLKGSLQDLGVEVHAKV